MAPTCPPPPRVVIMIGDIAPRRYVAGVCCTGMCSYYSRTHRYVCAVCSLVLYAAAGTLLLQLVLYCCSLYLTAAVDYRTRTGYRYEVM